MSGTDEALLRTRHSLHRVAEHVLSAARKRATGEISLVPGPGGVRTPPLADGWVLAIIDADIAVVHGADVRRAPLTTVRAAAAFAGTEPGFPWTRFPPGTDYEPDAPLAVDVGEARVLADWFAMADTALRVLAADLLPAGPPAPQVFPEHFDLAITVAEVNYGASPGDDAIPSPYLYVGPHEGPPEGGGPFWNASFGGYRTFDQVAGAEEALSFFHEGRRLAGRP